MGGGATLDDVGLRTRVPLQSRAMTGNTSCSNEPADRRDDELSSDTKVCLGRVGGEGRSALLVHDRAAHFGNDDDCDCGDERHVSLGHV